MFDIDKYLNEMEIKDMSIDEEVLTRTKKRCEEEKQHAREERESMNKKLKKALVIAVPTAAALLLGILAAVWLLFWRADANAVAYYTVDVNPSICVHVDAEGKVTGVVSQNKDAQAIVNKLQVSGENVTDAMKKILAAIKDAGYFDAGQKYVLIGCFAADGTEVPGSLSDLQAQLETDFGEMIKLLIISGNLEDLKEADKLNVSAGLLKLAKLANGVELKGDEKVEDVLNDVRCITEPNYCAPELSADVGQKINLSWDVMNFEEMGYAGKVRYSIAAGDTAEEAKSGNARVVKTFEFYTYEDQPLSCSISLDPGITKYFALYAQYGDIVKCSNAVSATMPEEGDPSPKPSNSDDPEPPSATPLPAHTMSGRVSGDKVIISWSKETAENFSGYKVVASKTNPTPRYPEDGYLKYITNPGTTSVSLYAGDGLQANTYYYFSVTYLFSDGTKIAANAVKLKVPAKDEGGGGGGGGGDAPQPSSGYPSTDISGSMDGTKAHLTWGRIKDGRCEGYKVMYSFTDTKPVYGDGSDYEFISDLATTSCTIEMKGKSGYEPGKKCYYSISALYESHNVVKAGRVITLTMPDTPAEPYPTTNIHVSLNADKTRVNFSWGAIDDSRLECYKVVGSRTDSSPSYPNQDYLEATGDTSWSISVSSLVNSHGGIRGERFYFAITAYYSGGKCATGTVASITLPVLDPPSVSPSDDPTVSPSEDPTVSPSEDPPSVSPSEDPPSVSPSEDPPSDTPT